MYSGMPLFGLAKATSKVPIGAGTKTAKQRMGKFTGRGAGVQTAQPGRNT